MSLDLQLIDLFVALEDTQSVTGAAKRLGIGQPAASAALAKLRKVLQDPLFVRTAHGMQPTARSQAISPGMRQVQRTLQTEVLTKGTFEPGSSQHRYTIASSDIGEMVFMPKLLSYLSTHAPGIAVRMVSPPHHEVHRSMDEGLVDLALGYFPDLKGNNIFQQRLFGHSFVCVVGRKNPIQNSRMTMKQFLSGRHVAVKADGRSQEVLERYLIQKGINRDIVLETPHFMTVPFIVSQSDLIATMPTALAETFSGLSELRLISPPFESPKFDLKQHWHRRSNQDEPNRWLRAVVAELFKQ